MKSKFFQRQLVVVGLTLLTVSAACQDVPNPLETLLRKRPPGTVRLSDLQAAGVTNINELRPYLLVKELQHTALLALPRGSELGEMDEQTLNAVKALAADTTNIRQAGSAVCHVLDNLPLESALAYAHSLVNKVDEARLSSIGSWLNAQYGFGNVNGNPQADALVKACLERQNQLTDSVDKMQGYTFLILRGGIYNSAEYADATAKVFVKGLKNITKVRNYKQGFLADFLLNDSKAKPEIIEAGLIEAITTGPLGTSKTVIQHLKQPKYLKKRMVKRVLDEAGKARPDLAEWINSK